MFTSINYVSYRKKLQEVTSRRLARVGIAGAEIAL